MPQSPATPPNNIEVDDALVLRHGSFCGLGGPCPLDVGDAMIYAQVNVAKIIGSPTSKEVGHPDMVTPAGSRCHTSGGPIRLNPLSLGTCQTK